MCAEQFHSQENRPVADPTRELEAEINLDNIEDEDQLKELFRLWKNKINALQHPTSNASIEAAQQDQYINALRGIIVTYREAIKHRSAFVLEINQAGISNANELAAWSAEQHKKLHQDSQDEDYKSKILGLNAAVIRKRAELFSQIEKEEIERQKKEERKEKGERWSLGLWPKYKEYRDRVDQTDIVAKNSFIDQAVEEFQKAGWKQLTKTELKDIFDRTLYIEQLIDSYYQELENDELSLDDINEIEGLIENLHRERLASATVTEAEVFYNRLSSRVANLKNDWMRDFNPKSFYDRADKSMLPADLSQYEEFLRSLQQLSEKLENYKFDDQYLSSPGQLSEGEKSSIQSLLEKIIQTKRVLNKKIPEGDLLRLESLIAQVSADAKVFLGTQTTEVNDVFTKDVEWWMFANHGREWHETQFFWEQFQAGNEEAISLNPKNLKDIKDLIKYFSEAIRNLDSEDVAFNQRFIALDVQLNRLLRVLEETEKINVVPTKISWEKGDPLPADIESLKPSIADEKEWQIFYQKAGEMLGPKFLLVEAKNMMMTLEEAEAETWNHGFELKYKYDAIIHVLKDYRSENEELQAELNQRGVLLEKNMTLFNLQFVPSHSWSMTAELDAYAPIEYRGAEMRLFDYFTLRENEISGGAEKFKYSQYVFDLVKRLEHILLHEQPGNGDENKIYAARNKDGAIDPFDENGVPIPGFFGFQYFKETGDNKDALLKRMEYDLKNVLGADLPKQDLEEIVHFAHRIASMLGIRLALFQAYQACGATPVDEVGAKSKYMAEGSIFPPELYSPYKKLVYLQVAEMFLINENWWTNIGQHKKTSSGRMKQARAAYEMSRLLTSSYCSPRDLITLPIMDDGIRIRNTYPMLYDAIFVEDVRQKRRKQDVTIKAWDRGRIEFGNYREMIFDTPGGINIDNIHTMSAEDVRQALTQGEKNSLDVIINKGLSYMKKDIDLIVWRDIAVMALWYIDRIFRVYAMKDTSTNGPIKLLAEVRARLNQANTIVGVGKERNTEDKINKVLPNTRLEDDFISDQAGRKIMLSADQFSDLENNAVLLSPSEKKKGLGKVVDVRTFLLESLPDMNFISVQDGSPKLQTPKPGSWENAERIRPAVKDNIIAHPLKTIEYRIKTNSTLRASEWDFFKASAEKGVFGRPPQEQQKPAGE